MIIEFLIDYGGIEIFEIQVKNIKNNKIYVFEIDKNGLVYSQYFDGKIIDNPDTFIYLNKDNWKDTENKCGI